MIQPPNTFNLTVWSTVIKDNDFSSIFVILYQKEYTVNALFIQTIGKAPTVTVTNWLLDSLLSETHSYHSASVILTAQFHIFSSQCAQTYCCHNNLASAIKKVIVGMILLSVTMEHMAD